MILIVFSIPYIPKETCLMAYKNCLHNPQCYFKLLDSNIYVCHALFRLISFSAIKSCLWLTLFFTLGTC